MPTWQRTYLVTCAAIIGFCLAYTLSDYGRWPRLTYFPYEREWKMLATPPGTLPMQYVGTFLWGLGGSAVAAAITWLATTLRTTKLSDRALRLAGGWAIVAFIYGGAYFTWNLWPF